MERVTRRAALLFCATLLACSGGVSEASFEMVKTGMSLEEVKGILGEPTKTGEGDIDAGKLDESVRTYTWEDGDKVITVTFMKGKVAGSQKNF